MDYELYYTYLNYVPAFTRPAGALQVGVINDHYLVQPSEWLYWLIYWLVDLVICLSDYLFIELLVLLLAVAMVLVDLLTGW